MNLRRPQLSRTARSARLQFQALEERWTPTWGAVPPTTIAPPASSALVSFNAQNDAAGSASIVNREIDYYRISAPATGSYRISTTTPNSSLDTVVGLFSSSGQRLAYNDDVASNNTDSAFTASLTAGQTYYVGITNWNTSPLGSYNWSIDGPAPVTPVTDDAFENNDTRTTASNLGSLTAARTISNLIMADAHDYYSFTLAAAGGSASYAQIDFSHAQGDLDLELLNSAGTRVGISQGTTNSERISLNGLAAGTYTVHAYGYRGATNPSYSLALDPAAAPTTPTIDLSGASLVAGASATWGQTVAVTGMVRNSGNVASSSFAIGWYLSRDAAGSADDLALARVGSATSTVTVAGLGAGATSAALNATLQLPTALPAGWSGTTFYVVMRTDVNNTVAESNEANNFGTVGNGLDRAAVTITTVSPPPVGGFTIQLNISGMTASQTAIFQQAAARWSQVITGDLPNATYNGVAVDDLLIEASGVAIDGPSGTLGQAGWDRIRSGANGLPYHGIMEFDTADLASMESSGSLFNVILHEMGHVLGVGTLWSNRGMLSGAGTSNPRFTGVQATAAYNALFGRSDTGVPVENTGGGGTRDAHWRESVFNNELMTGWINNGSNPMSRVTVASLADLGYTVNMNAADSFTPSAAGQAAAAAGGSSSASVRAANSADLWFAELYRQSQEESKPSIL